jgi:hypothetical protein
MEDHEEHDHASLMLGDDDDDDGDPHGMEDDDMDIEPTRVLGEDEPDDFWDHEPSLREIWEMKKATKRPSEWLKLLCKEWVEADDNLEIIETADSKFESYKPYLKGKLSSQLLCRLCIPSDGGKESLDDSNHGNNNSHNSHSHKMDFLKNILDIRDDFDKAYVIAQVERFCAVYDIRGTRQQSEISNSQAAVQQHRGFHNTTTTNNNNNTHNTANTVAATNEATAAAAAALYGDLVVNAVGALDVHVHQQAIAAAAAATANHTHNQFLTADATAAAVAAAQQAAQQQQETQQQQQQNSMNHHLSNKTNSSREAQDALGNNKTAQALLTKAQQQAKSAERALEQERRQNAKREQRRLSQDKKMARQRDREFLQKQKMAEKEAREKAREEKRTRKLLQRQERERFAQEQKEAALRRAAELVASNRVPIEITRAGGRARARPKVPVVVGNAKSEVL